MKSKVKKILCVVITLSTIFAISGCKWNNKATIKKVTSKLKDKYGQNFEAQSIGDRLDTKHTVLYCYPEEDDEVLFTVYYYDDEKMIDDYVERKQMKTISDELESNLKKYNIQAVVKFSMSTKNTDENKPEYLNMTVDKYINACNAESITGDIVVNIKDIQNEQDATNLANAIKQCSQNHNSIKTCVGVYFIKDDDFEEVKKKFKTQTYINASFNEYIRNSDSSDRKIYIRVNTENGDEIDIGRIMSAKLVY